MDKLSVDEPWQANSDSRLQLTFTMSTAVRELPAHNIIIGHTLKIRKQNFA